MIKFSAIATLGLGYSEAELGLDVVSFDSICSLI